MRNIPKPQMRFSDTIDLCLQRKYASTKTKIHSIMPDLVSAMENYDECADIGQIHTLQPLSETTGQPLNDVYNLYEYHLIKKGQEARQVYDRILLAGKKSGCGFCNYSEPEELDHFLPISEFPEFSIYHGNLVPICHRCNKLKLNHRPRDLVSCLIHPYYDEVSTFVWLKADLDFSIGNSPTAVYTINPYISISNPNLFDRLQFQFKKLELGSRYSIQANKEIAGNAFLIKEKFNVGGESLVRDILTDRAKSWEMADKNSWQAALYLCLAENNLFCKCLWDI